MAPDVLDQGSRAIAPPTHRRVIALGSVVCKDSLSVISQFFNLERGALKFSRRAQVRKGSSNMYSLYTCKMVTLSSRSR
jgi:hypothetical protein